MHIYIYIYKRFFFFFWDLKQIQEGRRLGCDSFIPRQTLGPCCCCSCAEDDRSLARQTAGTFEWFAVHPPQHGRGTKSLAFAHCFGFWPLIPTLWHGWLTFIYGISSSFLRHCFVYGCTKTKPRPRKHAFDTLMVSDLEK